MCPIKYITLEEELKKNPELKLSDIQILREWCEKQPHLPKIEDVELAIFLYLSYYYIESTKNTIENYYTYRTHAPELFSNRDILKVKQLRDSFEVMPHIILESTTKEGYHIMATKLIDTNTSHYFFNDIFNMILMTLDEFLWTYGSVVGLIYVCDGADITMGHVGRFNITTIKKLVYYTQDVILQRIKGIHLINMSQATIILYNMMKPFFNDKLSRLFHIHSTLETVSEYLPIEALPNELGGKAGAIRELQDVHLKKMENLREFFLEDEKCKRVNESLRIGKCKTSSDLFGVDGSFKKLDFD
ncbi:clavesin-2-like [Odontomachus brunneus]|uniref:clavesin-2-like n=1 Tax=Odontomachus brunneus TaxID=486640 RepID=UPI0013F18BD1|nr:clavesin-2-like [Odontomachus brunneus]